MPQEQQVPDALRAKVPADCLYFAPGMDPKNKDEAYRAAWQAKHEAGRPACSSSTRA